MKQFIEKCDMRIEFNRCYNIKEAKKYYRNIDEQIMESVQTALNDLRISDADMDKIMFIIAMSCDRHYKYGYTAHK